MNIEILNTTPEIVEEPGLQTTDPRFSDITALIQSGDFAGAASASESILQEGVWDIRVIGYFCYGAFVERGLGSLCPIFRSVANLLKDSQEALGPAKNRNKIIQSSLNWMMKQVLRKVQHEEVTQSVLWKQWLEGLSSDEAAEIQEALAELVQVLSMVLEDLADPVKDITSKINGWLGSFAKLVCHGLEKAEPESVGAPPEGEPERIAEAPPTDSCQVEVVRVEGSYHLTILMKKIKAFEQLIEREKFSGAALVADDINNTIASFDPRLYFPKFFARFSMLYAKKIGELAEHDEQRETAQWRAMEQFYAVDLDGFVNS